jgi:hypothetical protein
MFILHLASLATGNTREDANFWQFLLHHPFSDLGILVTFYGILVGNMGMWKMMDAANSDAPTQREMFSTGAETDPISPPAKRSAAISKYREMHPDGPFYKMLRKGQILSVVGALVMLIGGFI